MLKRVDNAVFNAFNDVKTNSWSAGFNILDLKAGGVGYAMDENNAKLVDDGMKMAVEAAADSIKSGAVKVHNYMDDSACPAG